MAEAEDDLTGLLTAARHWRQEGHGLGLATVLQTWGSAPRRAGSHLLIRDDGLFEGSVSGGCVEGDVIVQATELIQAGGGSKKLSYGVADAQAWEVGLACGGQIEILIQTLDNKHFPPDLLQKIGEERGKGNSLTLATDVETGRTVEATDDTEGLFVTEYRQRRRLALVGAVHITQALAPMARLAGYDVTVIDPRGMFAAAARFDDPVNEDWPDEALDDWKPDAGSAIVTLTHDPKIDDPALIQALRSPAFYIGALGSRKTHASRVERLHAQGFTDEDIARIDAPVGLSIGAIGPAEIAISILGAITAAYRSV